MFRSAQLALALLVGLTAVATAQHKKEIVVTITSPDVRPTNETAPFDGQRPAVDVALVLDTSNSMDGLISQAKNQLWTIVQQFAKAKQRGQTPHLRVALFEYGNTNLPASEGYIRQVVALTDDLDQLSEGLFKLTTQGGDEYCGQVIDEALTRLDWSNEPNAYQAIFIAGNEPFTQGSVDYRDACRRAIEKGVVVNTIHCGAWQAGVDGQWKDGAQRAEGEYFNIDQDRRQVHIECPQDQIILRLNTELNKTYLWYGDRRRRASFGERQHAQDANAAAESVPTAASRAVVKAGSGYANVGRDLIDSLEGGVMTLEAVEADELPEEMQRMTPAERQAHVKKLSLQRKAIQVQIAELNEAREEFLRQKRSEQSHDSAAATLGDVMVQAVQKQLVAAGFDVNEQ